MALQPCEIEAPVRNSDYTDHPAVYQSMLISFTSLLLQGVSNEKQRRVNLAITDHRGIAAIRELCRTRHASRQASGVG